MYDLVVEYVCVGPVYDICYDRQGGLPERSELKEWNHWERQGEAWQDRQVGGLVCEARKRTAADKGSIPPSWSLNPTEGAVLYMETAITVTPLDDRAHVRPQVLWAGQGLWGQADPSLSQLCPLSAL